MSDSALVSRFIARQGTDAAESEEAVCDNLGCFGWLRGIRDRAVMLELRKATGDILAVGYAWIDRMGLDPSEGITLYAGSQRIRIRGKCLNEGDGAKPRLFEGLTRHRVPWIQEGSLEDGFSRDAAHCFIELIEW